jgi:hypothetical protein
MCLLHKVCIFQLYLEFVWRNSIFLVKSLLIYDSRSILKCSHGTFVTFIQENEVPRGKLQLLGFFSTTIFDIKPGIHDTSFASKSPFKKTWIKKTWIQVCVYTMQEILMYTHKFWREIQQTKWHFWEERRVLPFVLHYYVQLYCEGD